MNNKPNKVLQDWQERDKLIFGNADLSNYVPSRIREFTDLSPTLIPKIISLEESSRVEKNFTEDLLAHYGLSLQLLEKDPQLEIVFYGYCTSPAGEGYRTSITDIVIQASAGQELGKDIWQFLLSYFSGICLECCEVSNQRVHLNWD